MEVASAAGSLCHSPMAVAFDKGHRRRPLGSASQRVQPHQLRSFQSCRTERRLCSRRARHDVSTENRVSVPTAMHDIRPAAQNNKIETPDFRAFSGGARCPGKRTSSKLTMPSEHPELQFRGVRHPAFVPRRRILGPLPGLPGVGGAASRVGRIVATLERGHQ
jgi:hypothetical protein